MSFADTPSFKVIVAGAGVAGLEGTLALHELAGGRVHLRAHVAGGHGFSSEVSDQPFWSPPRKIVAKFLGTRLESLQPR